MSVSGVVILLKSPHAGTAKSRLAATLGRAATDKIYIKMLSLTKNATTRLKNASIFLSYGDPIPPTDLWPATTIRFQQPEGDLGVRLIFSMQRVLQSHPFVLAIGTDCPNLSNAVLTQAARALQNPNCDMVIGPTFDGGYYLLGLKTTPPTLFEDIPWSTDRVFELTLARAATLKMRVFELPPLRDVDVEADLAWFPTLLAP